MSIRCLRTGHSGGTQFEDEDDCGRFGSGARNKYLKKESFRKNLLGMTEFVSKQTAVVEARVPAQPHYSLAKFIIIKCVAMTALTIALAVLQGWAAPRFYKADQTAGFNMGLLEGALMPAALPGLLMGHDLPIYAPNNAGRPYNIGYILGINTCGTLFFGIAFWKPPGLKLRR
jgi:hypothetical protein